MGVAPLLIQLRAAQTGTGAALLAAPRFDLLVVAAQQNGGHRTSFPHFGAGVLGVFQQTVPVAFFLVALLLCQHAGLQAQHTVCHHKARQFAAGQDIITNGDLFIRKGINHALVDALVVPAHQCQVIIFRQPPGVFLGVSLPARRQKDDVGLGSALFCHLLLHIPQAVRNGLGIQHHAAAAAIGIVVGLLLAVESIIPDLMAVGLNIAPL